MPGDRLIIIAASTGGPKILIDILSRLPDDLPSALIVVQHMLPTFVKTFCKRLAKSSRLPINIGTFGMRVRPGSAILAPGKRHLIVSQDDEGAFVTLDQSEPRRGVIPSADMTMLSAAPIYQDNLMGVVLTGMGWDGVDGLKAIKEMGGVTIAEDEDSSAIYGMPGRAIKMGFVDKVLTPPQVANEIIRFSTEDA